MAVPIILILDLLKIVINLLIKAECWVAGVDFLLLAIFAVLCHKAFKSFAELESFFKKHEWQGGY